MCGGQSAMYWTSVCPTASGQAPRASNIPHDELQALVENRVDVNIYVYIYTYIYVYMYMCIYLHIYTLMIPAWA